MSEAFISSIQDGYGDVREAVRRAVESLDVRPLMAELAGAHAESPQRALLDLVARADVLLLIVGSRYSAPTEDEFNEANRLGKPILVLRQNGELDAEQAAFLERVAAGWSGGRLWATFDGAADVSFAAVRALTNVLGKGKQLAPAAAARAADLVLGPGAHSGSIARVAYAPLVAAPLLDAVALERPGLADVVADLVRSHRLVDHTVGIQTAVTRDGIAVAATGPFTGASPLVVVGADGAVVCDIQVGGSGNFGSSLVDSDRLASGIAASGALALDIWKALDEREEVQQAAVALSIPNAQNKVFGTPSNPNSLSMGWRMPPNVTVPQTPVVVRRGEVGGAKLVERLLAEVRRVFTDAGALAQ